MERGRGLKQILVLLVLFGGFALVPLVTASNYHLLLAGHILLWGLFAVAFNMLWGVTGMLSFGQALFYGLGAYSVGLMVKHVGAGWFLPGIALGLVASVVLSIAIGLLIIRVSGVFFTVLTLAFGQLAWQITFRWYHFTGGDDGIQGILPPGILGNRVVYLLLHPCRRDPVHLAAAETLPVSHGAVAALRAAEPAAGFRSSGRVSASVSFAST